jgi:hypothetical protein
MGMMFALLGVAVAWAATIVGYLKARSFVRERLRYVDGVHRSFVPLKVGLIAALVTAPVTWLLPLVTVGTSVLIGAGIGFGVAAGRRDIRSRRYLQA